jgi:hypothetical protein
MDWLAQNWFWVVLVGAFIGMHLMGGGCGGHGHRRDGGHGGGGCGHGAHGRQKPSDDESSATARAHQH